MNIYVLKTPKRSTRYSLPFFACDDDTALSSIIEISRSIPEVSQSYLLCLGSYDPMIGRIRLNRSRRHVKGKSHESN